MIELKIKTTDISWAINNRGHALIIRIQGTLYWAWIELKKLGVPVSNYPLKYERVLPHDVINSGRIKIHKDGVYIQLPARTVHDSRVSNIIGPEERKVFYLSNGSNDRKYKSVDYSEHEILLKKFIIRTLIL